MLNRVALLTVALLVPGVPSTAFATVGAPLVLDVTPDSTVAAGDTVVVSVTGGDARSIGVLLIGQDPASLPLGELTIDIQPVFGHPLGLFAMDGSAGFAFWIPPNFPLQALSGQEFQFQAASVALTVQRGPPTLTWRKSNLDSVTVE